MGEREAAGTVGMRGVVVTLVGVVLVAAVGVVLYDRLAGAKDTADLSDAELEAALLTETEVDEVMFDGRPERSFEPMAPEAALDDLLVEFEDVELEDLAQCREASNRLLLGRMEALPTSAFLARDGSRVVHQLYLRGDRMPVSELAEWTSGCATSRPVMEGAVDASVVPSAGATIDDLGDGAFQMDVSVQFEFENGTYDERSPYLTVAVVERDGVVSTLTVVSGDPSVRVDEGELVRGLARAADARLLDRL